MSEVMDRLEQVGKDIITGHKDIELIAEEVNLIWELEVSELTENLRAVIIEQLRNNRQNFAHKKAKAKAKKISTPIPEGGISLDDLDLEIKL